MSLLSFDNPPKEHKTTMIIVIKTLCEKASNMSKEDINETIEEYRKQKVR